MSEPSQDAGVISVLAERLVKQRLPRLEQLNAQLDRGDLLNDLDIRYLKQALEDAQENWSLLERNPELKGVGGQIVHLYKVIMEKALANEKNQAS